MTELDIYGTRRLQPRFYTRFCTHTKNIIILWNSKTDTLVVKDASEKFHIYRTDWTVRKIDVYVDNQNILLT